MLLYPPHAAVKRPPPFLSNAAEESTESIASDEPNLLEATWWWGFPSLFRCPAELDPAMCDIALVGVPHSPANGSTERDQHLGPRAVRNVSAHNRRLQRAFDYFSP